MSGWGGGAGACTGRRATRARGGGGQVWLGFIRESRNKANRLDAAKELKNVVLFNQYVVTPLVSSIRRSVTEAAAAEIAELLKQAKEAAAAEEAAEAAPVDAASATVDVTPGSVSSEAKVAAAAQKAEVQLQKEVTLAADLPLNQRQDLYRNYLLYCMTGDQVYAPMGTTITIERDATEFERLSQLGDVLGLSPLDVSQARPEHRLARACARHPGTAGRGLCALLWAKVSTEHTNPLCAPLFSAPPRRRCTGRWRSRRSGRTRSSSWRTAC